MAVIGTAALVLVLGACGGADDTAGPDAASATRTASNGDLFNGADVTFATEMIPHHAQAVQMTVMVRGRPTSKEFTALVESIRNTQVAEVEEMADWLTAWGEDVPETSMDHANGGHDLTDMSEMPGMSAEMSELFEAPDEEFEAMWLTMMIEHHDGATALVEDEIDDGLNPAALALAESIQLAQQAEIEVMEGMLD